MIEILAQIDAPKNSKDSGFCVGIVLWDDVVVEASGVVKYMKRWSRGKVRTYCAQRGWTVTVVHQLQRAKP